MNRYFTTPTTKAGTRQRYATFQFPDIPKKQSDIYLRTDETDRLDLLAYDYYNDTRLWWIIATANPGIGRGTFSIPAGTFLRIPDLTWAEIQDLLTQSEIEK